MNKYKYNHDCPFEAYITNLEKYNEGELVGKWVEFPTTTHHLKEVYKKIGVNHIDELNQTFDEWFVTDYDIYVDGITALALGDYPNLQLLNDFSRKIDQLTKEEIRRFSTILKDDNYSQSLEDMFYVLDNLHNFEILHEIKNTRDLGRYHFDYLKLYDTEKCLHYVDYEWFGSDIALEERGTFTDEGYIVERCCKRNVYKKEMVNNILRENDINYNSDVIYLCKLPAKQLLENEFGTIVNDDVVISQERIKHIENRRIYDYGFVIIHLLETIKEYDYLISSKDNTIRYIKKYNNNDNLILVKLSLNDKNKANSVITGIKINDKELKRLLRNNKIIDKK